MNKLFIILYTGVYIPWCILLLFYIFHYEWFHFLSTSFYVTFAILKLSHMEHLHYNVVYWNRMFIIVEMCLIVHLLVTNITGSGFLSFISMVISFWSIYKLKIQVQKIVTQAPIYSVCLLFLMTSSSSLLQQIAASILIFASISLWKMKHKYDTVDQMEKKLTNYYQLKIIEAYMVFILEWSSSPLHVLSGVIFIAFPMIYSCWAYYSLKMEQEDLERYYYYMDKLPVGYPIPLNFKHAVDHCNIAKNVFKPHSL